VVVNLESPGGMVHGYGLASSQLARLREHQIPLTICVDKVAASGGYMMACLADTIIAAPFAIIGSIGVVAQIPNFHRLLEKWDIDFEVLTAANTNAPDGDGRKYRSRSPKVCCRIRRYPYLV
jgi:serine protease SohB